MSMAVSANFMIDIGGVAVPTVSEVSAPSLELDIVEHKDVNDKGLYQIHRVPGKYKAGNITVTRHLKAGDTNAVTEKVTIEHTGLSLPGVDLIL